MKNLAELGLILKTLNIADLASLVADINHNFSMILKLPAYKGIKGDEGDDGVGSVGIRGSVWKVIDTVLSASIMSAYGLTSPNQITLGFVNVQIVADLPAFLLNFGYTELVHGDVIVLPDLSVIIYNENVSMFEDTGITFANGSSLTVQQVQDIVTAMLAGSTSDDSIDAIYLAVGKLFSDVSGGINTVANNDSVLDIPAIGAGGGVQLSDYKLIAPKEAKIGITDIPVFIRGAAQDYHRVIQNTLENDTHDYAAGFDNAPIMVMLQNDYNSGIFIGHRDETSMRLYSKIYKTASNSLRITGRNELSEGDMTYLDLASVNATLYGKDIVTISTEASQGVLQINTETVQQKFLTLDSVMRIGNALDSNDIAFYTHEMHIFSDLGTDVKFLSLSNNLLSDSGLSLASTFLDNDPSLIVTSDLMNNLNVSLSSGINTNLNNFNNLVATLIAENHFIQRGACPQDLNTAIEAGIYQINPNPVPDYSNLPDLTGTLADIGNGIGLQSSDGGALLAFRYDNTKTLSISAYDMVLQVLFINVPDGVPFLTNMNRGQLIMTRTGSSSTPLGTFNFSEWETIHHDGMFDMEGIGLEYAFDYLNNKHTLNLEDGVAAHASGSGGTSFPTTAIFPYITNMSVDTHGRSHSAAIGDLDSVIRGDYVPLDTWHNVGDAGTGLGTTFLGTYESALPLSTQFLRFRKFTDKVTIEGDFNTTNITTGTTLGQIFQLPVGYRPSTTQFFYIYGRAKGVPSSILYANDRLYRIIISTGGSVFITSMLEYQALEGGDININFYLSRVSNITFPIN